MVGGRLLHGLVHPSSATITPPALGSRAGVLGALALAQTA